jgi:hypothetical protein
VLFRQLGTGTASAAIGAFAWANNPHGINMSLLWLSGRTSLLMTLFSSVSVLAFLRRWRAGGAVLLMCALLSKEDALAVPVIVIACRHFAERAGRRDRRSTVCGCCRSWRPMCFCARRPAS